MIKKEKKQEEEWEKKHVGEEKQVRKIDMYQRHSENENITLNKKKN